MLKRFYDLRDEIATVMDMKGKIIPELSEDNWVRDLAFLVDLTMHFNDLNTKLQGHGQFVHHLYSHVKTFQSKLQLWENSLEMITHFISRHWLAVANQNVLLMLMSSYP